MDVVDKIFRDIELHGLGSVLKNKDEYKRMLKTKEEEEVFLVGKHKGKTYNEVCDEEPSYIVWAHQNGFPNITVKILNAARFAILEHDENDNHGDLI